MLQQTRVDTVIPYFVRFTERFPTVHDLASAPIEDVLAMWSGLGYYRRARSMSLAAREVVARFDGRFPKTREHLESLPGIGPYTAGAIASIAYGREEALVDGNVSRVLARVLDSDSPLGSKEATHRLWETARALVRGRDPGALNQSLMELGALVCTPRLPRCGVCPIHHLCRARAAGTEGSLPRKRAKRRVPTVELDAFVIERNGAVLLGRRPETGLFAGLYEPPMVDRGAEVNLIRTMRAPEAVAQARHVLTHRVLDVRVLTARAEVRARARIVAPYSGVAWIERDALRGRTVGLSSLARRVLESSGILSPREGASAPPIREEIG